MASGKWVNRGEVPYVIGFCRHYGANLIGIPALASSFWGCLQGPTVYTNFASV
jgi:hypothetical protein